MADTLVDVHHYDVVDVLQVHLQRRLFNPLFNVSYIFIFVTPINAT